MKTIVFLHPHFLKPAGASKVVLEFASRLQKHFKIIIITIKTNPQVISSYPGLNIINLGGPTTGSLLFWATFPLFLLRLHATLNNIPSRIIFAHSLAIYWTLFLPKSVLYFHDLGFPYSDSDDEANGLPQPYRLISKIVKPIFYFLNQLIINNSNYFMFNSHFSANYFRQKYEHKADAVISPGIDSKLFRPLHHKENMVYTLGRLEKVKQIDKVIHGFSQYCSDYHNTTTKLFIIGNGIQKKELISLSQKLKINNQINFKDSLSQIEVASIAGKSKIGIFFRTNEPLGMAAMESMSCGTPVIGVNNGGIAETVVNNKTGILIPPTSNAISKALNLLLSDKNYLKLLSTNSANHIRSNYSWDKSITQLKTFFDQIKLSY